MKSEQPEQFSVRPAPAAPKVEPCSSADAFFQNELVLWLLHTDVHAPPAIAPVTDGSMYTGNLVAGSASSAASVRRLKVPLARDSGMTDRRSVAATAATRDVGLAGFRVLVFAAGASF